MSASTSTQATATPSKTFPYIEICVALIFLAMTALMAVTGASLISLGSLAIAVIFAVTCYQMRDGQYRRRVNETLAGKEGITYIVVIAVIAIITVCLPYIFKLT